MYMGFNHAQICPVAQECKAPCHPSALLVHVPQTMAELMRQVESSSFSGPDLSRRKDICSSNTFASAMTLDMVGAQRIHAHTPFYSLLT